MGPRRFPVKTTLAILALAAIVLLTHSLWLGALGSALVSNQGPAKADMAVVLAGDYYGHRILEGGEMVRQGYVPAALVSGPPGFYGHHESELAIPFAVDHGYPERDFIPLPVAALSTRDEAHEVLAELERRQVHSFLLVTSNYHTARAARVFRAAERGQSYAPPFRTVAAEDEFFRPASWWRSRQGRKIVPHGVDQDGGRLPGYVNRVGIPRNAS